jgi:protease IV
VTPRLHLLLAAGLLALACDGRPRTHALDGSGDGEEDPTEGSGTGTLLEFDLTRGAPESRNGDRLFALPAARTYTGLVRALENAARDPETAGFFLRLGDAELGWARSEELGRLFSTVRSTSGKKVLCHADTLDNTSALLAATACDEIWLSPAGEAATVGIAGQAIYFKSALEKLDIQAQFLSVGEYKSAVESFTRDGPSDATREAMLSVLGDLRETWLETTRAARSKHDLGSALELGPWGGDEARQKGLVDAVGMESEALAAARRLSGSRRTSTAFGPDQRGAGLNLTEIVRLLAGAEPGSDKPHIAVVPAEGAISMTAGGLLSDGGISARAMRKVLRRLARDDAVKAVVLRIDSPGGSALASDLIWHEVMELRKKKPVIASIGEMAASGGYYIACAASRIVAERLSIVGSIGVFGGKVVLDRTLASLGVNAEIFAPSPDPVARERAAYLSPLRPWDEATQARVRAQMVRVYDLFVQRVATGRGIEEGPVRKVAEGRIWSGRQGLERRLVDELGGLSHALELAREAARLDADAPIRVEGAAETLLEMLMLGEGAQQSEVQAAFERLVERRALVLDRVPAALRPFVAALQGLSEGESVAAALPFGVIIR